MSYLQHTKVLNALCTLAIIVWSCACEQSEGHKESFADYSPYLDSLLTSNLSSHDLDQLSLALDSSMAPGAFDLNTQENRTLLKAGDLGGLIYGSHELISQLKNSKEITATHEQPEVVFRAIKFNLPWDSYRRGESLQLHMETCKDLNYWRAFLDMMAANRFNALTLWNLHPFNFMIQAKGFPAAHTFSDEEYARWKRLYKGIFAMAKERGIETYIVNWNIYAPNEFLNKHGLKLIKNKHATLGDADQSPIIKAYTKQCVTQVINEYPNLTGLGFSLGEFMGGMNPAEREQWILDTFIAGINEADRKVKLIHRVPFSANEGSEGSTDADTELMTREAIESIEGVIPPIWVEVKFNWSHAHSTPKLIKTHGGPLHDKYWNPAPTNYRIAWMMRNEDFFCLRWGSTDFIKKHLQLNNQPYAGGYFIGSESYIPAKDYFTKPGDKVPWNYAFERQWLYYMVWGRLLYNPNTPDSTFQQAFKHEFGPEAIHLFEAYQNASQIPLEIISAFDIGWDFTMHAETFSRLFQWPDAHLIDINTLIAHPVLDPQYMNTRTYVQHMLANTPISSDKITPVKLAQRIEELATATLDQLDKIGPTDEHMKQEVGDARAWALLGKYYSHKLKAAIALELFRNTGTEEYQHQALVEIEQAIAWWDQLAAVTSNLYQPFPIMIYMPKGDPKFHWANIKEEVHKDKEIIAATVPLALQ
ncbi:hypothetical protein [Marinoscillum furvescens]|uniref:Glycosyl hydrolase family 20 n=1 Tax=Marinoscillum furvescens DSM 4134 TaxID=1122208 RepID=A0A3D9KYS9_MARFU|nr:hypothetical protein [Marinoscillum furvescens]RED93005.1 hypothetical protein C7460_12729 [Marinoscillum furvescens DSM 4134]